MESGASVRGALRRALEERHVRLMGHDGDAFSNGCRQSARVIEMVM
jgi:hypothetical protein